MSELITVKQVNATHARIDADMGVHYALHDHFAFRPANYKWNPKFKAKVWDGYIRLYKIQQHLIPVGLIKRLEKFSTSYGAELQIEEGITSEFNTTYEYIENFSKQLNIHSDGNKITPHDYQIEAVVESINEGRMVAIAPTSAGKSLILYIIIQYYLHHKEDFKSLLVVPSIGLVYQMYSDFKDYQTIPETESTIAINVDEFCHMVSDKTGKESDKQLTISTWQSFTSLSQGKKSKNTLHINEKEFFNNFNAVFVDECHTASAKVLTGILDLCTSAYIRLGVTGTLDGTDLHQLTMESLFGKVYQVTTTRELIDTGAVSDMEIKCIFLTYPEEERKLAYNTEDIDEHGLTIKRRMKYDEEIKYTLTHPTRMKFLVNLSKNLKGNTLILIGKVEILGKKLYEEIQKSVGENRKVFFIYGKVEGEDRDKVRAIVEKEDDAIIIATYQTFQQGVSIKRLHNVILGTPSKSQIRVLQSLGRGLRKGKDKNKAFLYDIVDDLSYKKHKNYGVLHALERIKMYAKEQHNYKIVKVNM